MSKTIDDKFIEKELNFNWSLTKNKIPYCQVTLQYLTLLKYKNETQIKLNNNKPLPPEQIEQNIKEALQFQRFLYLRDYNIDFKARKPKGAGE